MRVSGFWSLAGAGVAALLIIGLANKPAGTSAAFAGATNLETAFGNQITGSPASATTGKGS